MSTYATVDDIRARLPYRTIDTTSIPTTAQVQAWLDGAEAQINSRLQAIGLSAPYVAAQAVLVLRDWVADYVRGLVLQAWSSSGDSDSTNGDREVELWRDMMDEIFTLPAKYGAILGSSSAPDSTRRIRSYVLDNADGRSVSGGDFDPVITRDSEF